MVGRIVCDRRRDRLTQRRQGAKKSAALVRIWILIRGLRLSEKRTHQVLFLFVLDAYEKFGAEPGYRLGLIERQTVVDFAARKMAGLTSGLKDRFDLGVKGRLFCGGGEG